MNKQIDFGTDPDPRSTFTLFSIVLKDRTFQALNMN